MPSLSTMAVPRPQETVGVIDPPYSGLACESDPAYTQACTLIRTQTSNVSLAVFPAASVAVHVTVVTPSGNRAPLAGAHTNVTPGALSVATGSGNVTFTPEASSA
jgi:hypothetical protein